MSPDLTRNESGKFGRDRPSFKYNDSAVGGLERSDGSLTKIV